MDKLKQKNWTAADHYRWLVQLKKDNPTLNIHVPEELLVE